MYSLDQSQAEEHKLGCVGGDAKQTSDDDTKLSCRVTDFRLSDIPRSQPLRAPASFSAAAAGGRAGAVRHSAFVTSQAGAMYTSHSQVSRGTQNRLLSDLMRRNHDRQLFSLL